MKFFYKSNVFIGLFFLLLTCVCAQSDKWNLPDSSTGKAANAILTAIEKGDDEFTTLFVRENITEKFLSDFPLQEFLRLFRDIHNDLGAFKVHEFRKISPNEAQLIILSLQSDRGLQLKFMLESQPPHKIARMQIQPASNIKPFSTISELDAYLKEKASANKFSGAVLIARSGKPVFQAAYGDANREKKIPNTVDTKFRFGSMAKMFTAVSIMQLVQAGKIKLDDPLGKFIPNYPNKDTTKVTVHQLLTHTGGTGDIFGPRFDLNRLKLKELKDYIELYGDRGPEFAPGSRHVYSNYGFILLGRIIEVVSGQSYYDYVREHIFIPSGMNSTGNQPEEKRVAGLAVPYTRGMSQGPQGPLRSAEDTLPFRGTSAGGGYSTVGDFMRFANALMSNKLLNAKYTKLVTYGKVIIGPVPGPMYAYGFVDGIRRDGARYIGHNGGAPGMNGVLTIIPKTGYVFVILANLDPPVADEIERFMNSQLR